MKTVLSIIGVLILALVITIISMDWLIVSVHESGADGTRVWIPVPIAAIRLAVWAVPDKIFEDADTDAPEFAEYEDVFRAMIGEIEKIPDAVLVEVTERNTHVVIRKQADVFVIDVTDGDEDVRVRVPVASLRYIADAYDGQRFDPLKILEIVHELPHGDFVHVREPGTEVRLAVW
jgi:hypothetical protein